jgi:type III secretory pathway component EscR
METSQKPEAAQ